MFLLDLAIQVTAIGSRPPTAQSKGEQLFHVECVSILSAGVAEEELGKGSREKLKFNSSRCGIIHFAEIPIS